MTGTYRFDALGHERVAVENQGADGSVAARNGLARELDAPAHVVLVW
jgi:hypothetical protein